jgi:hypothetical protein
VTVPVIESPIREPERIRPSAQSQVRNLPVVLMSTVGNGFSAVIIILVLLTIGLWYFGNRVIAQLTVRRAPDA